MWSRKIALACAASAIVSMAAFAQTPAETSGQQPVSPPSVQSSTQANDTMTLVGCLINESDYRRAHELGKGGIDGLRTGHDFVLVDAGSASTQSATRGGARPPAHTSPRRRPAARLPNQT